MTRKLRRFQKTIFGMIAIAMLATSMVGFGVNWSSKRSRTYAIRVNQDEVSFDDFAREKRAFEERYRSQFGEQYAMLLQAMNINIAQTVADNIIVGLLLKQLGRQLDITVSDSEVTGQITSMMGGSVGNYEALLAQVGMTAPQFEQEVRRDVLRRRVSSLISDAAMPLEEDVRARARRDLSKYDIEVATIDPQTLMSSIPEPSAEQLAAFFEENKSSFEEGEKVSYEYVLLDGSRVESSIPIEEDAVQYYYSTHEPQYQLPDSAQVSLIRLDYPKDADDAAKKAVKDRADDILKQLNDGAVFADLAKTHSQDAETKDKGGDLGWVVQGTKDKEFDAAVFRAEPELEPQLLSREGGYDVIRVNDYKPGGLKPLTEVRAQIEAELRKEDVPAYLAHESDLLFSAWTSKEQSLSDFAKERGLTIGKTEALLAAGQDPTREAQGLTNQVIAGVAEPRQLVELADHYALVEVKDQRPRGIPSLEEIRNKVITSFRSKEADKKAEQEASAILEKVRAGSRSLTEVAKESSVSVSVEKGISFSEGGEGVFRDTSLRESLLRGASVGHLVERPVRSAGSFVVARVSAVMEPTPADLEKELGKVRRQLAAREGNVLLSSVLNTLKASAQTDIDTSLLVERSG